MQINQDHLYKNYPDNILKDVDAEKTLKIAADAAENAYAPYSKFKVGACALFEDGKTYSGCNVENASYGLTLCAERNALSSAITEGQKTKLIAVAIYSPNAKSCFPCGACRQWITEFSKEAVVIVESSEGKPQVFSIKELLPFSFELDQTTSL